MPLIITLLILISTNSYAGLFDSKLAWYECNTQADANACNSNCTKTEFSVEYKIDKKQNKIFRIVYSGGKQIGSSVYATSKPYSECSIFDEKNWKCETVIPASRGLPGIYNSTTMANGRVAQQYSSNSFSCGK